ncbi:aminotransferase class V-fold PLP-dependent enzyme [Streptomyces sp. RFCAC02]|uniref:aminotransferase class V-fold PLP-dependent enzyme n=1 Tax=Streptomyces sp. RFCAC02 TaxID=2499143 RepID=UPI00101EA19E|nr:aminotransferase class V-fold PLP-dependent enzyme [Streptomyces sp. RFCAC02]
MVLNRLDIDALRHDTPGCAHRIHLNNAGAGLLSSGTLRTMTEHLDLEARTGGYEAADAAADRIARVHDDLAALIGGRASEIALFDNSTRAWQAAFAALAHTFRPGDRILTGRAEYGSNVLTYFQAARRTGVEIVVVPNDEHGALDTGALAGLIDERTKLVGVSHVPTGGGLVNPAAEIGRITRAAGVPYLLDATQSVGQFPVDVAAIGCDLLAATGRKFLRGPRGTGFLWAAETILPLLDPPVAEIASAEWDGDEGFTWRPGARRFETWEKNYAAVLGLGTAVREALALDPAVTGARAVALGTRLRDALDDLPGVTTHDLGRDRCAIVTASVAGVPADEVAAELAHHGINVSLTNREGAQFDALERKLPPLVRLSPHYYTTQEELDRAVTVVGRVAANAR